MIRATFNHKKIIKNEYYNKILLFQPHQEDIDMQAVISERRSLEILKRSLPSEDARDSEGAFSRKPSTAESLDSYVSVDESHSPASKSPVPGTGFGTEGYPHRVPTIECEEPSIEEDENSSERRHLKVGGQDTNRLSLDRSRSDETGSWMTVECDEFIGSDTSDNEPRTLEPDRNVLETQATLEDANPLEYSNCATPTSDLNILLTPPNASPQIEKSVLETFEKYTGSSDTGKKKNTLDKQSDRSKSSDSWTSGEKDTSPQRQQDWSLSVGKEKSSVEEESSVSCSIARPLGISQDFGKEEARKCQELKQRMLQLEVGKEEITPTPSNEQTPTNEPKILVSKKPSTPTLEKQSPIDLGTSTESYLEPIEERIAKILDRGGARTEDSESSSGGSRKPPRIEKPARANAGKKLSVTRADAGKSGSDRSSQESKSSFDSKGSLSVESRGSFETESSSGSLGAAQRRGELAQKEQQSTWRPFPIESSNSSSTDDPWHHVETDGGYERYDAQNPLRDSSDSDVKEASPDDQKDASDASYQDELNDFPATFGYPAMTSSLGGIGVNPTDIIGYSTGFTLGRTLSRISERSTASEKSSMEDDVSKASTHSVSMRDESVGSTDHQPSLSSDSRSNTNLAYISDADRRTSAEMPEIPCDSATGDRLSSFGSLNEPKSPTLVTGRFSVTHVDEQQGDDVERHTLMCLSNAGSQDSEDWPLPEIPFDHVPVKPADSLYAMPDLDKPVPKSFCWKASLSFQQSQDSLDWPSPPSSAIGAPIIVENIETYYASEVQSADKVILDEEMAVGPPDVAKVLPYEDTAYLMSAAFDDNDFGNEQLQPDTVSCLSSTLSAASCLSSSLNVSCTTSSTQATARALRKNSSPEVIVAQPTRSPAPRSPLSEDELFSSDDVFMPGTIKVQLSPDAQLRKLSKGSNNSDTSIDDILSGSTTYLEDQTTVRKNYEARLSSGGGGASCKKCSHSSHSEEETSSLGTDLDGTVRMGGLQQKKCTHSSHSEDTSIGLSISEWSTGTNTVRQYANLSGSDSLSAVSTHSCAKSEKSNQTKSSISSINKSAESLNEQSGGSSFSHKFSGDNGSSDGLRYDMLSNSETDKLSEATSATRSDDTTLTLTEMAHTISEWSTSSSRTLVGVAPGEYLPLKQALSGNKTSLSSPSEEKRCALPQVHRRSGSNGNQARAAQEHADSQTGPETSAAARKRRSLEMMSKLYQSQEICSESESPFVERLYAHSEKLTERYQSQEFVPLHGGPPASHLASSTTSQIQTQQPQQVRQKPRAPQPPTKPKPAVTRPIMQALLNKMKQPGLAEQAAEAAEAEEKKAMIAASAVAAKPPPPPVPTVPPIVTPSDLPGDAVAPPPKPLAKHHSYDDRTLSKTQIREFKTTSKQLRQSSSFHEHMLSKSQQSSQELPMRIDEERDPHSTSSATNTTTTTNTLNSESTEPNSPQMPQRADKLVRCSPYYSSSLSSESPPNQLLQKPPRKTATQLSAGAVAASLKSPPSGNDTDSSLDVRGQEAKMRSRGYRKKRQLPVKRMRANLTAAALLEQAESSECSEGYVPEVDSGSSEYSSCQRDDQYLEFDEELERDQTDDYEDYPQYSGKFESLDMSDNVDEMGFPRYDRLSHITKPMYHQALVMERPNPVQLPAPANHPMPPATGQPVKPARTKKRQFKREDSTAAGTSGHSTAAPQVRPYHGRSYCNPEESEYETRGGGLSDELANSSEDSCIGFGGDTGASGSGTIRRGTTKGAGQDQEQGTGGQARHVPYPDFLSDYESEPIEYERYACGLDIRVDPPPKFHDSDELSDQ